ncbi:MAG TPA: dihydrolipoyl dehydrogenase [Thermoplasmata archaeon]|nr:dihydrolipoyl dehydrogenase [Thermoplasmata archaeon]
MAHRHLPAYRSAGMPDPREYGVICIGTGSSLSVVDAFLRQHPESRAAVIDRDTPGGICLTRGCIPSKLLLYPAEVVRTIQRSGEFGIDARLRSIDFGRVMRRMRENIGAEVGQIRAGLTSSPQIDYFHEVAEFVAPYTLQVGGRAIRSKLILLGLGSETIVPAVPGLREAGFLTSDSVPELDKRPDALAIIGGGYIAAEYAQFFSAMGSKVTVLGRNPRFLPSEDPEIAEVARAGLGRFVTIHTNHEVARVASARRGRRRVTAIDRSTGKELELDVDAVLVAAGRGPTSGVLHPERAGIRTTPEGWVVVNERLETSQPGVYALGDANGHHLFKHKANYEARVVYRNAILGEAVTADYHAIPHAVFSDPEVAGVGLTEPEARQAIPPDRLRIGRYRFDGTAKGEAMGLQGSGYFMKVLTDGGRIVGAHIVGPDAAVLLQEVVTQMYTPDRSVTPIVEGMHIHPALSEVVERAFLALGPANHHHEHTAA